VVEQLRNRQVKNFLTLTLLGIGTPMLLMGDEMRRTQRGNNNAYCQNNETSWLDWELLVRHADIHRFAKQLISLRLNGIGPIDGSDMTLIELLRRQPVQWHGVRLDAPDWSDDSHSLAATVRLLGDQVVLHLMVNAYWEALRFEIPAVGEAGKPWRRVVDTFLDSPDDICDWDKGPIVSGATYPVQPRSVVLLVAQAPGRTEQCKRL
jgi:glycogen operon protein